MRAPILPLAKKKIQTRIIHTYFLYTHIKMEEELDMNDMLISLLTTEDGQNVCDVLADLKSQVEVIGQQLAMQNKILVKMLTAITPTPTDK
jgi:hypothetical protein